MDSFEMSYLRDTSIDINVMLATGGLLVFVLVVVIGVALYQRYRVPGEEHVTKEEYQKSLISKRLRKRLVNRRVGDKIGDTLLDMYAKGELNDEEYTSYIRRLARHFKDFQPRKLTPKQLKVAIQRRLNSNIYKPVKLPNPDRVKTPSVLDKILSAHYN